MIYIFLMKKFTGITHYTNLIFENIIQNQLNSLGKRYSNFQNSYKHYKLYKIEVRSNGFRTFFFILVIFLRALLNLAIKGLKIYFKT
jgi:hypothetical protein